MTKSPPVKLNDTVEVLTGCPFSSLVHSRGIVRGSLSFMSCVVEFPTERRSKDFDSMEVFEGKLWCIHWKYLKVLDSPYDSRLGELESQIQELEENLMFTRSCLSMSEELRDQQEGMIQSLIEEVDALKKGI